MNRVRWRWIEKDFGFRFKHGGGNKAAEYYQAARPGDFYIVPAIQRKLTKQQLDALALNVSPPAAPKVVPNPWQDYQRHWDWIVTDNGICLNYAGCLDREEIHRREDEGVARAMEYITDLLEKPEPVSVTIDLICRVHKELMGTIYPFAGEWRTVDLHKGAGPTKWPYPRCGIQPLMEELEQEVLSISPFISDDDEQIFDFVSSMMNEVLAIHPFREGNGRLAFILGNLVLLQNDLLPLDVYDRRRDEERYFDACEQGRIHKDYKPLALLIGDWEAAAIERWEASHGKV